MTRNQHTALKILVAVALITMVAQVVTAHEPERVRHGFFLGADLGMGGATLKYEIDGVDYETEEDLGAGLTLRLGYQFVPWFSLSLDARGVGQGQEDDHILVVGSSAIIATFYPGGGGFFIRLGVGGACITTELPADYDTRTGLARVIDEETGITVFGLGYEWMANEHFSLGLSMEARGGEIDDFDEITDATIGEATFGLSMNYYF